MTIFASGAIRVSASGAFGLMSIARKPPDLIITANDAVRYSASGTFDILSLPIVLELSWCTYSIGAQAKQTAHRGCADIGRNL